MVDAGADSNDGVKKHLVRAEEPNRWLERAQTVRRMAWVLVLLVGTVLLVGLMLYFAGHGLDLTDEGYYLNRLSHPRSFSGTSQFPLVYHGAYVMVGGDVAWLRRCSISVTLLSGWLTAHLWLTRVVTPHRPSSVGTYALSAALGCPALLVFGLGLTTPNYNVLTIQALLVAAAGLILVLTDEGRCFRGWVLIGIGGWISFLGRPTAALVLAVVALVAVAASGRARWSSLLTAVGTAIGGLLFTAGFLAGSLRGFVRRLSTGFEMSRDLAAGHTLSGALRWDSMNPEPAHVVVAALIAWAVFSGTRSCSGQSLRTRHVHAATAIAVGLVVVVVAGLNIDALRALPPGGALFVLVVPVTAVLLLYADAKRSRPSRTDRILAGALLLLPVGAVFGSNNNYWRMTLLAGVFWILAGAVLLGSRAQRSGRKTLWPTAFAGQAITALLIVISLVYPYRQPGPLWDHDTPVEVGRSDARLLVSEPQAGFISSVQNVASDAGLSPEEGIIDLSGALPGVVYALGAEPVGPAWTLGGYPGSKAVLTSSLGRESCGAVVTAWLLLEPRGQRAISSEVLTGAGIEGRSDYEVVAWWWLPSFASPDRAGRKIGLLRPVRSEAIATVECLRARRGK